MDTVLAIVGWLTTNWQLVVALAFGLLVLIGALGDWLKINQDLRNLFLVAEKALAKHLIKNGPDAMKAVVVSLYLLMPLRIQLLLRLIAKAAGTTDLTLLERFAQWVYDGIKATYERELNAMALRDSEQWCTFVKRKL